MWVFWTRVQFPWSLEEGIKYLGDGVTGRCEMLGTSTGNAFWSLAEQYLLLNYDPLLHHPRKKFLRVYWETGKRVQIIYLKLKCTMSTGILLIFPRLVQIFLFSEQFQVWNIPCKTTSRRCWHLNFLLCWLKPSIMLIMNMYMSGECSIFCLSFLGKMETIILCNWRYHFFLSDRR